MAVDLEAMWTRTNPVHPLSDPYGLFDIWMRDHGWTDDDEIMDAVDAYSRYDFECEPQLPGLDVAA